MAPYTSSLGDLLFHDPRGLRSRARSSARGSFSTRPFWLTIALITLLAILSLTFGHERLRLGPSAGLVRRNTPVSFQPEGEECRFVHAAVDQCAFVKANCQQDEAGLLSYLRLYYCSLAPAKPLAFTIIILWLGLLFSTIGIAAADFLCINLSSIASILGMSENLAGVTFLAFGNGSPDVFSTIAAISTNSGGLAVGELVGAAGFITTVVAGSMALVRPFKVARKGFVRDVGFFIAAAVFTLVVLVDEKLYIWECAAMVGFYAFYVLFVCVWHWYYGRRKRRRDQEAVARAHYVITGPDEADIVEEYHDDEVGPADGHRRPSAGGSVEDFNALERASAAEPEPVADEDEPEEDRDRFLGELNNNMHLRRPRSGTRRNTYNPIRPSLMGALEFRALLSSLQKSQTLHPLPHEFHRYHDDPQWAAVHRSGGAGGGGRRAHHSSTISDPATRRLREVMDGNKNQSDDALASTLRAPSSSHRVRATTVDATPDRQRLEPPRLQLDTTQAQAQTQTELPVPALTESPMELTPHPRRKSQDRISNLLSTQRARSPTISLDSRTGTSPAGYGQSQSQSQNQSQSQSPVPGTLPRGRPRRQGNDQLAPPRSDASAMQKSPDRTRAFMFPGPTTARSLSSVARRQLPKISIPVTSAHSRQLSASTSPFPLFVDPPPPQSAAPASATNASRAPSLLLPQSSLSLEQFPVPATPTAAAPPPPEQDAEPRSRWRRWCRWWPALALPPPAELYATLLPTVCGWREKSFWEKVLGVVSAPSVLLLTITLPVVELRDDGDDDDGEGSAVSLSPVKNSFVDVSPALGASDARIDEEQPLIITAEDHSDPPPPSLPALDLPAPQTKPDAGASLFPGPTSASPNPNGHFDPSPGAPTSNPNPALNPYPNPHGLSPLPPPSRVPSIRHHSPHPTFTTTSSYPRRPSTTREPSPTPTGRDWTRWLTMVHCFTAPFFLAVILWANTAPSSPRALLRPTLISLVLSLTLLLALLLSTTRSRPPRWRPALCFLGFAVSIAWISTIAGETVGVLKALGVILDISDAILGLTVFAIGNSMGDLVADITVARLGFPVMALSACFGGPMLNILLGIGIAGLYMALRHPDRLVGHGPDVRFHALEIEVGGMLLVSGVSLLCTLVGLLVVVPLRKWRFDRVVGAALVVLWFASISTNLGLEVTGHLWGGTAE